MENIIKSFLGRKDDEGIKMLELLLSTEKREILSESEKEMLTYLKETFDQTQMFPSEDYFISKFREFKIPLENAKKLSMHDTEIYLKKLVDKRSKQIVSRELMKVSSEVAQSGFTDDHYDKMRQLYALNRDVEIEETSFGMADIKEIYKKKKEQPAGLLTFVKEIDSRIGGLSLGTLNVIFGWVGSFKSTWAINIFYNNTVKLGYNVAVISLEVPKEDIKFNLLARHSFEAKFKKFPSIPHDKIRQCILTEEEEAYVFGEVLDDLENSKGSQILLDETDFKSFSFGEIRSKLEEIDASLQEQGKGHLDAVVWDHANLFKFSEGGGRNMSQGDIINSYISFIRQLSIKFVKDKGEKEYRKLCNLVLAQCNREGWKRAEKLNGVYDLRALSEANELERAAYRIMSVYTNENLKESKEATVQLLKNRSGATLYEPTSIFVDPVSYVAGDELDGFDEMIETEDFDSVFGGDEELGF